MLRTRVHLNVAMSLDGAMSGPGGRPVRLSSPEDWSRVHRLRHAADAVLVGAGTVRRDDPSLLAAGAGEQPLRVVLDPRLTTPRDARVFAGGPPTLLVATRAAVRAQRSKSRGEVAAAGDGPRLPPRAVLHVLADRGVRRLLVEGGARVAASFLSAGVVREATVFVAPTLIAAPSAPLFPTHLLPERSSAERALGGGLLRTYRFP